jgi:hypothetical protein
MQIVPAYAPAPVNAHVWIRRAPFTRASGELSLRAVAPKASEIAIATREWCPHVLVELVPQSPLPPSSRFEVWFVPRAPQEKPLLVASFGTGTTTDTTPPPRPAFPGSDVPDTFFAAWSAKEGRIDWEAPPLAVFAVPKLDPDETCHANLTGRIGIRAMDLAGNLSEPIELTIDEK